MITIEKLKDLGCDTDAGLTRCLGDASFYMGFLPDALDRSRYEKLETLIREKDYDSAFETAHAIKGILATLALDPILEPVSEMTEALRSRTDMDYSELLSRMWERFSLFENEL